MSSLCAMWARLRDNSPPSVAIPSLFSRTCLDHTISSWEWHCYCQGPLQLPFIDWISPPILHRQWAQVNYFLWLIALRAVKVRDSLQNWAFTDRGTCAAFPLRETGHCFLNYIRVKRVYARFAPSLTLF